MDKPQNEGLTQDKLTHDPGLKFLEELERMPYTNDRVGQVSVSSWKGRPFGKKSSTSKPVQEKQVTDKTREEILQAPSETLSDLEHLLKVLMADLDMTLEEAIDASDELP